MDDWKCPKCGAGHDSGSYPDHYRDCGDGDSFEFDCDCGCTFHVEMNCNITFRVIPRTVKMREPDDAE